MSVFIKTHAWEEHLLCVSVTLQSERVTHTSSLLDRVYTHPQHIKTERRPYENKELGIVQV
jgi:hypothetical protein